MSNLTSLLKKRVEIENPFETADGGGGFSVAWQNFATIWAEILPISTTIRSERFINSRLEDTGGLIITIRYIDGITPKMRVKYGTRLFNIRAVIDPDENKEVLEILAEEGVAI